MRTAAKIDANQNDIVRALRSIGACVQSLAQIGKGCPDLLVAYRGKWFVAEIKDGSKPPSKRKLTPDEQEWHNQFNQQATICIWYSVEDAINTVTGD